MIIHINMTIVVKTQNNTNDHQYYQYHGNIINNVSIACCLACCLAYYYVRSTVRR